MRVYRLDYKTPEHKLTPQPDGTFQYVPISNTRTEWFTSERAAAVRRLMLFKTNKLEGKKRNAEIWGVDIPIRKAELVTWLTAEWESK